MKKILTAALAAALSTALTFTAFAAPTDTYVSASTHNYGKTAFVISDLSAGYTGSWSRNGSDYIYKFPNGSWANSCWLEIDGEWYHFNGSPAMETGWIQDGGNWYYLRENEGGPLGSMVTGWNFIDGNWYYFGEDGNFRGILYQNTTTPDGCTVGADGVWVE